MTVTHAIVDMGDLSWTYNSGSGGYFSVTGLNPAKAYGISNLICSCYMTSQSVSVSGMENCSIKGANNNGAVFARDSAYTDGALFTSAVTGQKIVYELATPVTVTGLTPETLSTLLGTNVIWADTGAVGVTYKADTKAYIDGKIAQTAQVTRAMIADSAVNGKAPKSLSTGDLIIVGDELRKATANIGTGNDITATNSTTATLADVIKALQ